MSKQVEFFFDVGSPTAYLAWTQLPAICQRTQAELVLRPMLLGGVFKATGNTPPAAVPAKGKWMLSDLALFAKRYGVALNFNPHFPINTLVLMRGAVAVQQHQPERFDDYLQVVFKALWVEGKNLNDAAVVAEVLSGAGFDVKALLAQTQSQDIKDRLKANTEEAVARGAFGAPTCFVGKQLFFGQDRLDFVEEALAAGN